MCKKCDDLERLTKKLEGRRLDEALELVCEELVEEARLYCRSQEAMLNTPVSERTTEKLKEFLVEQITSLTRLTDYVIIQRSMLEGIIEGHTAAMQAATSSAGVRDALIHLLRDSVKSMSTPLEQKTEKVEEKKSVRDLHKILGG